MHIGNCGYMQLGYSCGVGGVDMLVGVMLVGLRNKCILNLGVHAIGDQYWGGGVNILVGVRRSSVSNNHDMNNGTDENGGTLA